MRRNHPPAPDMGPCPQRYMPVEVDDKGMETQVVGAKPEDCPGRMRQFLNADASACDACFFMVPHMRKQKEPARIIEAPGRFRPKLKPVR